MDGCMSATLQSGLELGSMLVVRFAWIEAEIVTAVQHYVSLIADSPMASHWYAVGVISATGSGCKRDYQGENGRVVLGLNPTN